MFHAEYREEEKNSRRDGEEKEDNDDDDDGCKAILSSTGGIDDATTGHAAKGDEGEDDKEVIERLLCARARCRSTLSP